MDQDTKHLRLSSCVSTLIEVHRLLSPRRPDGSLLKKFKELKASVESLTLDEVSEQDVQRVESATNLVLEELGAMYSDDTGWLVLSETRH
jgi:trimethylamine:corrinoid methyltransferase-like protein